MRESSHPVLHHACRYFLHIALWILIAWMAVLMGTILSSCQTYAAVVAAPEEFWVTAEEILTALVLDIWAVIEALL